MCSQVTPAELFLYHPSLSMLGGFTHSPNVWLQVKWDKEDETHVTHLP
ncbi:hypothetical protein HID58_050659 [Brassica napus]|uniref:Uncharacterized protein n=1 Tax=Brassica napus TaxID=3708 RepID=A0ABQ8A6S1_BRANA|nr:hypothetical protein HID58_050659 [Brassica napus]